MMLESSKRTEMDRMAVEDDAPGMESTVLGRNEPDLIDLLLVLTQGKKAILRITIVAAVVALVVSLLLPKMYTATTTILPPQESQSSKRSIRSGLLRPRTVDSIPGASSSTAIRSISVRFELSSITALPSFDQMRSGSPLSWGAASVHPSLPRIPAPNGDNFV